jgi:hypothetical protein
MMMRVITRRVPLMLLFLLTAGALSSCGGGSDFSGDPEIPDGYKTYEADGISFAYPGDWQVAERTDEDGAPSVEITPPDKSKTPYGLISVLVARNAGDRFESLVDQSRIVVRDVNNGKIDSDESVDVPGAKKALRSTATVPAEQGSDPVEVKSDNLDLVRDNNDVVNLTVAAPQRDGQDFDPSAVVDSFRLDG